MTKIACVICLMILALTPAVQAEDAPVYFANDPSAGLSEQIARNWLIDFEAGKQCREVVDLRVYLLPDGTVSKVDQLSDLSNDACRRVSESARRAVYATHKLDFSGATVPPTMILQFNSLGE